MFSSLAAAVVVIQFIPAIIGTNNGTKKYFISEQFCIVAVWNGNPDTLKHGRNTWKPITLMRLRYPVAGG
jgi:hypothetical protein